jgi:RNA polymerase sigma factor (TIGR02999 family)
MAVAEASSSSLVQRVTKAFEELRASGKSSQEIFVTLYGDLKQLARMKVQRQPAGGSMHATRLLSDLYMRLFGKAASEFTWESGRHFFNTMALAMQQLLHDHARQAISRGRGSTESLDGLAQDGFQPAQGMAESTWGKNLAQENIVQALSIRTALERLEREGGEDESKARAAGRQAEIVRLRVFLGLTEEETAEILGCSSETVTKEFRKAKAKLARYLQEDPSTPEEA